MRKKPVRKPPRKAPVGAKKKVASMARIAIPDTILAAIKAGLMKGTLVVVKSKALVVKITDGVASPEKQHVKSLIADRVKWQSTDDNGYSVEFEKGKWPFAEAPQAIEVPAWGPSAVYTVSSKASGSYAYAIYGGTPGPTIPEVIVDP